MSVPVAWGIALLACLRATTPHETSVLVTTMEVRGGVDADLAAQVSDLVALGISRQPGVRVVTQKEIERSLSLEQQRQLASCDSEGCIAEIVGALNADELVIGSLGRAGDACMLNLVRMRARDAHVLSRTSTSAPCREPERLFASVPAAHAELWRPSAGPRSTFDGIEPPPPAPERVARPARRARRPTPAGATPSSSTSRWPSVAARGVGIVSAAGALVAAVGAALVLPGPVAVVIYDATHDGRPGGPHAINANLALAANLGFALGACACASLLPCAGVSAIAWILGWVLA